MSFSSRLGLACLLMVSMAACSTRATRPSLPPGQAAAAELAQQARETALQRHRAWSLQGRIAVSTDGKGGSGRIDWTQDGEAYDFALSAPVTRQGWRLSGDAGGALLEGLEGGPRVGGDAGTLLQEATGWQIPVVALADWVRGARANGMGPAQVTYGLDGRLIRLEQGGWNIEYVWPQSSPTDPGAEAAADPRTEPRLPVLPARVDARRDQARVRLIVDQWHPGAP